MTKTQITNKQRVQNDKMNINSLCDDLLIEIFDFLPLSNKITCETVCRRWRMLLSQYCQPRALRFELLFYKRSNYRVICKVPDHQFTDFDTIKYKDVHKDIHKLEKYLIDNTNCLPVMVDHLQNLTHFQCKSFGDGMTVKLVEKCKFLLMKLKHFSLDYKEEDITKISIQPWIQVLLEYGTELESVYIKFQRMGIKFPFDKPLPVNLRYLYLPSCDLTREEFYNLLKNGGTKLEELSLHSISSNFLQKLLDEMPFIRKLNTRIRVDQNDDGTSLEKLRKFKKMELFAINQFVSPADTNNQAFSLNYGQWTIIEVLANCPGTKHLQLKNLPIFRRYNSSSTSDDEENFEDDQQDFINNGAQLNQHDRRFEPVFDILMDEYREDRADRHLLYQIDDFEYAYILRQFRPLNIKQLNWDQVELNEKKNDRYLNEALNRLIICLSEFINLRELRIENLSDKNGLNSYNILRLVQSCVRLSSLHLGMGRRITSEIVDLFVERAIQNPFIKFELKFKNYHSHHFVLPLNLSLL